MNHSIHTGAVENVDDLFNVGHIVMGVADYPNAHNTNTTAKGKPGVTRLSLFRLSL
jgi:hypothetical protein